MLKTTWLVPWMTDAPGGGSGVGPKIEEVSRAALSLLAFDLFIRAKLVIGKDILDKFYFYAFDCWF